MDADADADAEEEEDEDDDADEGDEGDDDGKVNDDDDDGEKAASRALESSPTNKELRRRKIKFACTRYFEFVARRAH